MQGSLARAPSQAIDLATGTLDVDYAGYLSRHDVVVDRPVVDPKHAATVGNGRVGAMVWTSNGIDLQITGVDASEHSALSAGHVRLTTLPAMGGAYASFHQRLSLYDGVLSIGYGADRAVTVFGAPNSEVLGIHVEDSRPDLAAIALEVSLWDTGGVRGVDLAQLDTWRTVSVFAGERSAGLSRGQKDPDNFGYTLAATVEGAGFRTERIDARGVRLVISPAREYTIWIACASRLNAPDHDSIRQADTLLREVSSRGYAATLSSYRHWWHDFWHKSFVQYARDGGSDDYLENLYYLYSYIIAAGSYGNYPFQFIHGDFESLEDADSARWSYAYWHWNERAIYGSFLASNHPEITRTWNRLYSRNFETLVARTRAKYHRDGVWVPEVMGFDGNDRHNESSDWTKDILSTGAEVALDLYAEYLYTNDAAYLRTTVYPFVRAVAEFYAGTVVRDEESRRYGIARSNALETYWGVRNAVTDLAAMRRIFPLAIRLSRELHADIEPRERWRDIFEHLARFPLVEGGARYAPHEPPVVLARNGQNVTGEIVWPYGLAGIGTTNYRTALDSWLGRPFVYGNIWSMDAVQAARLGLGDEVLRGLTLMAGKYQTYPNGLTDDLNGRFEYLGTHLTAINESLLQSHDGTIRVFPAPPSDPNFIGRFTLAASGAFLVSAEREQGEIKYVALKSLRGSPARIENPWGNSAARVTRIPGHLVLATPATEFEFATIPGAVYLIERTAKPLRDYLHLKLTGFANDRAKQLAGTNASLGAPH